MHGLKWVERERGIKRGRHYGRVMRLLSEGEEEETKQLLFGFSLFFSLNLF